MKPTTNANIGGQSFRVDEDAYEALDAYLKEIEEHLRDSDSKEEIMQDIEARIAELLQQHLQFSHMEVVNIAMVEDVTRQLGKPEVITDGFDAEENQEENKEDKAGNNQDADAQEVEAEEVKAEKKTCQKKLYRNIDDQMIGGVCSGLAKRLGTDAVWIRLLFALLFCIYGGGLFIYLLLWLIIPAANTTARRLEMNGIEPSAENIQAEIEQMNAEGRTYSTERSAGGKVALGCLVILALPLLLGIFGIIFGIIALIFGIMGAAFSPSIPIMDMLNLQIPAEVMGFGIAFLVCTIVAIIIPIVVLIVWAVRRHKGNDSLPKAFWITCLVLFLLSFIGLICCGAKAGNAIENSHFEEQIEAAADSLAATYGVDDEDFFESTDSLQDSLSNVLDQDTIQGQLEVGEETSI